MAQHSIDTLQNHSGPKRRGELAELAFMYRASSEGISVAKPYGDSHPYDFLVQYGRRLLRIQVKSTFKDRKQKHRHGFQVIVARIGCKAQGTIYYSREEIDFVVAFIAPLDIWYVIPVEKLGRRHAICLYPDGKGQPFAGLYEEYREAWNLIKEEEDSKQEDSSTGVYTNVTQNCTNQTADSSTTQYTNTMAPDAPSR